MNAEADARALQAKADEGLTMTPDELQEALDTQYHAGYEDGTQDSEAYTYAYDEGHAQGLIDAEEAEEEHSLVEELGELFRQAGIDPYEPTDVRWDGPLRAFLFHQGSASLTVGR
jgi:hypothetical protein